ncbi:sugar-binding protein [Actinoplanes sp. TBRC 11911]|uniref:ricin-type beta-trefoil lectin domain protein n=1 Tax=Actinoplanes sp. TBRC 11911 TaxID=2729386 RepID=UPI00145E1971|nr:ricin-type beta-trefoil lectin domain protein [Actinoplanes sp. TBRC 11911]NMO56350.1 sugar-binding protein [Actinoplanes sp. TBRC 11911]
MRATGPVSGLRWRRGGRAAIVLLLSVILAVTTMPAAAFAIPGAGMDREDTAVELPDLPESTPVEQNEDADENLTTAPEVASEEYAPTAVDAWQAGSGAVDLTGAEPGAAPVRVADLPVALGVPDGGDAAALAGTWTVDLAAPESSQDAGVAGLIMKITPPATADPAAAVALSVDYTTFADLYGPQAADRFGLVTLPDCVYDSPDAGDCAPVPAEETAGAQTVPSEVSVGSASSFARAASPRRVVSGDIPVGQLLAEAGSGSGVAARAAAADDSGVVGALDTGASAAGDYTATPLQSSGSWAAGSSSGAFTYSYQIQVPETAGGLMPKVGLSYSSQSVDGRTSATNNQASWIGDGWDYNAGAITRTYANCRQDSTVDGASNAKHRTADLCWGSNNATLSLAGMTTELVYDNGTWTTGNGDGSKVELRKDTGLGNGDNDGEHWVVTTRDGTRYYFGLNRLPGWSDHGADADDPVTNSVLTVPVYANHAGEDCYQGSTIDAFKKSFCTQAWRWSLDYVEDVHGNAMSLWWAKETNYYARNFDFKAPVKYDRGGYLTHIDYGQRAGSVFTATAPARVFFTVAERCFAEGGVSCTEENFAGKDPGKYRIWYDTPADLRCEAGKKCWNAGPSFFTRKRLDKVSTSAQRRTDTTARQVVDEYQLKQSFPKLRTGPNTALWLESISRTGYARKGTTDASATLNPVRFEPNVDDMPNRVMRGDSDPRPGFSRLRIGRVINEYGGETVVTYKSPEGQCATGSGLPGKGDTAELKSNDRLCFPVFWHPDPEVEDIDWFHKYVVAGIEELPAVDGAVGTTTNYAYRNPGWKLAEQEFSKKSTRTYSDFAGFEQTTVLTGADDAAIGSKRTKAVTRYFRGMGDTVSMKDITGAEIAKDAEPFAGRIAEELTYADAGDADDNWLTRSVSYPQATKLAERAREGISPLRAWRVTEPRQVTYTKSSGTGDDTRTMRTTENRTTFDPAYGLPTYVESLGDTGTTGDESCTFLEYVHQTAKNIIGLTRQTRTSPTTCAAADFDALTTLSAAGRVAYDGAGYGTALADNSRGVASQTWSLKADGSGFQTDGSKAVDAIGRVVAATDPDGKTSKITYEPATGQAFQVIEENALGHKQTQELEPGRAVATTTTDANGLVSTAEFDPLGRLVKGWAPGRAGAVVPDFEATYTIPAPNADGDRRPPFITTRARGHDNRIETSVTVYDGLGRERQTQEQATGGGRLITDTLYNSSGEVWQTNNAYFSKGGPSGTLFTPESEIAVPNATRYTYDGLGRVLQELPILHGQETPGRATKYEYGTDWSTVRNPVGSASYKVFTDALGRTARVDTFGQDAPGGFTSMRYTYDSRGRMTKAENSAAKPGNYWSWSYDLRGRMVQSGDPDTGISTTAYDHRDRPASTTDARGITVSTQYDVLSRPVKQLQGSTVLTEATYDTAPGGIGLPATSTRYTDGKAYTQSIAGYTDDYQPTATTLTLPADIATKWGLKNSYTYGYTYTDTGLPETVNLPAVGGVAAEKLIARYDKDGLPLSVSGQNWYGSETSYSPYGQLMRSSLGAQPYRVWNLSNYDEASGALTDQQVYRESTGDTRIVTGVLASHRSYTYDNAGNVTSVRERSTGIEERQCFSYNPIGELAKAWTDKNQEACSSGPLGTDGTVNVAAGKDNAGYWQEYEYDLLGNRTKLVEKDLTGNTAKDATSTYTYGKADGSQPTTLTKVTKKYVTPAGAQVTAEAQRLYELTGDTKSITSVANGDTQELSWTWDGQPERVSGAGANGKTSLIGMDGNCLDLKAGAAVAANPIQLYVCNDTIAQKWAFKATPGQSDANRGNLVAYENWCLQPAANTAGSAVLLQKCDGSAAQQLDRGATGQYKHPASGLCVAATAVNAAIVLATCNATAAGQLWDAHDETRYIYGPDGSRLLTIDGELQATLNLGEAQVTVRPGGVLVNTQRTYAVPGGAVLRYAYATGASALVALVSDPQGTPSVEIPLSGNMDVRIRKQDPFGNQRGAAPLGVNMQTNAGFLGANRDDSSGFTQLGARLYDPAVGRFLSADPQLDLTDPMQFNGYTYSHNNPVTFADPTGMSISLTPSEMASALAGAGLSAAQVAQAQADSNRSIVDVILSAAWSMLSDFIGLTDAINCFGGDMWSCGSLIIGAIPWAKLGKIPKVIKAIDRTINAIQAWKTAKRAAEAVLAAAKAAERAAINAKKLAIERAKKAAQAARKKALDKLNTTSSRATQAAKKTGNPAQKAAQAKAAPKSSAAASSGAGSKKGGGSSAKPGGSSGASNRSKGGASESGNSGKADGGGEGGGKCNSFVPGTKVLMADGSAKPIEKVKAGDKVKATDPQTGETRVETVTAEITGSGVKHLVKVTIDTDGKKGSQTAEVTATDGHPFWVPELGEWVKATDLRNGEWLRTSAGTYVQVSAIERWTAPQARVHNLTVSDVHTYYVLAGIAPVLVHNCEDMDDHARASENAAFSKNPEKATGGVLHIDGHGSFDLDSASLHPAVRADILRSGVGRVGDDFYGSHVEIQAAFLMRKFGGEGAVGRLMITHERGMCGFCRGNVASLLPAGASLTVRFGRAGRFFQAGRYFG